MGELRALFEQCAKDERPRGGPGMRPCWACSTGRDCAAPRVVALDLADYRTEGAELRVRRGKGRKARITLHPQRMLPGPGALARVSGASSPGPCSAR